MKINEYIKENYYNMKFILECLYGLDDEVLTLLHGISTDNFKAFEKLSNKKQNIADKKLRDFIRTFSTAYGEFCIMDILYDRCHMFLSEFLALTGSPMELSEEEDISFLRLPLVVDLRIILFDLNQYFNLSEDVIDKAELMEGIKESLKDLSDKGYIEYEEFKNNNIKVLKIKDPRQKRKMEPEQRVKPISVSKGQDTIRDILYNNNVPFIQEYNVKINGKTHRFDFAIFDANGIKYFIEYDGKQHFEPVEIWGGEEGLKSRQLRDQEKNEWCKENNTPLIRISYKDKDIKLRDLQIEYSNYLI